MNKTATGCGLAVFLLCVAGTEASEFDGYYIGISAGSNKSTATLRPDKSSSYGGAAAGLNWDYQGVVLGVNGFLEGHNSSYTGNDAGIDAKIGLPMDAWLPYAKLGVAESDPGARMHAGLGVEYKFASQWSVNGQWTRDKKSIGSVNYINNNFAIGLNYYFGESSSSAAARDAAAREAAARDAAAREAAARDAAARETAARDAAARDAAARDAAKEAAAREAAERQAAARESWKTSIIEKPVRLEGASFASGSSKLLQSAGSKLDEVVDAAKQFPDIQLDVMGYTDNVGKPESNVKLSQARADAVKAYLVKKGVAAERISSKGFGADNPIADNATAAGRAKNRRVEIRYTLKEEQKVRVTP